MYQLMIFPFQYDSSKTLLIPFKHPHYMKLSSKFVIFCDKYGFFSIYQPLWGKF